MKVLIDTTVWSLVLRRRPKDLNDEQSKWIREVTELIKEGRVLLIGPIRQEILTGIREAAAFERLKLQLREFEDEPLTMADYERAALSDNLCKASGISGSDINFLICAIALQRSVEILTTDHDFQHYARILPIKLYQPRSL